MSNYGKNGKSGHKTGHAISNGNDERVSVIMSMGSRVERQGSKFMSPVYIVLEFVITRETHQSTKTNAEREENLTGSINPDLDQKEKICNGIPNDGSACTLGVFSLLQSGMM